MAKKRRDTDRVIKKTNYTPTEPPDSVPPSFFFAKVFAIAMFVLGLALASVHC